MSTLKTNYQDAVASGNRKYRITANADGTSGIADATTYSQEGSQIGAADLNATNTAVLANAAGIVAVNGRVDTLNQNLAVGYDSANATAQVTAVSGTYTAPGNGTLVFTLPYNSTGNTIGIVKDGIILASYASVVANTQYIPFHVYSGETYGLVVAGSVNMRFVPEKVN